MYTPAYTELCTTPSYGFYAFINIWCLGDNALGDNFARGCGGG